MTPSRTSHISANHDAATQLAKLVLAMDPAIENGLDARRLAREVLGIEDQKPVPDTSPRGSKHVPRLSACEEPVFRAWTLLADAACGSCGAR